MTKLTRLKFILAALPVPFLRAKESHVETLSGKEIYEFNDPSDWSREFIKHVKKRPWIVSDHDRMETWFDGAMAKGAELRDGDRQKYWASENYNRHLKRRVKQAVLDGILWSQTNEGKDLVEFICHEIYRIEALHLNLPTILGDTGED